MLDLQANFFLFTFDNENELLGSNSHLYEVCFSNFLLESPHLKANFRFNLRGRLFRHCMGLGVVVKL